jgi:glycosyltransferase involved in cell wall biosynthesis
MSDTGFSGRAGLQQRVLPFYRAPLFDQIAVNCAGGLSVFAGEPRPIEKIETTSHLKHAQLTQANNRHYFSGSLYICRQTNLLDWLQSWQPDVLVMEANPRYLDSPSAIRWMHSHNRPVIGWGLGSPKISGILAGVRNARRIRFVNSFDALIAYSRSGAQEYAELGFPADKIFVAPNAAAVIPTHPVPNREGRIGKPVVLFVGRLQERKRVDYLLKACADLPSNLQPEIVIVGDGPDRNRLEQLALSDYPTASFTGMKTGPELDDLFRQADLFVLPGTGGLAIQQAMSFGLPVIVAEGDGTQSDLVRKENGWQVIPGSLEDLTEKLRIALSDRETLTTMGRESYRIVKEEINLEQMASVFIQAMNKVCQR